MADLGERTLLHRGRRFDFEIVAYPGPDGATIRREVVRHPGAVLILPVHDDGAVTLIRNFRIAVGERLYELPAGTLEPPEPPRDCAARELLEEAGLSARSIEPLIDFYTTPGLTDERMHAFIATGLSASSQRLEPDEQIEVHTVPADEALRMIADGRILDAKSILALLIARDRGLLGGPDR